MASNPVSKLTEEQYLAIERAAEFKSEFIDGEMFAMAGGSNRHAILQGNLFGELYVGLRGSSCRPFGSDSRVSIPGRACVYPDVTVACGQQPAAGQNNDLLTNPVAIFEVLSPSTEKYDRGLKFQLYLTVDSLRDYILVNQDQVRIEHFTRQPDGIWIPRDCQGPDEELKIDSIGLAIPLHRIYDQLDLAPRGEA
jgi:Uma2 family endonuclease